MRAPQQFDAFYSAARHRVLLQTYALTGDLPVSRAAVKRAFVAAWQQWRNVGPLDDPEAWVRDRAWTTALAGATARIWHRDSSLDEAGAATLETLGALSLAQRKVLLLTQFSAGPLEDFAAQVDLTPEEAERELQAATARFAMRRDVPSSSIRAQLEALRNVAEDERFPRPSIIRRLGTTRRRSRAVLGALAVVGLLLGSGTVVTQSDGVRPRLHQEPLVTTPRPDATPTPPTANFQLSAERMLESDQVARLAPKRRWRISRTSANIEGDGTVMPCQVRRFADPGGVASLVRTFRGLDPDRGDAAPVRTVQLTELSLTTRRSQRAFDRMAGWFGGCTKPRTQLLSTHRLPGVGEESLLFSLQNWHDPATRILAGMARTGLVTTVTVTMAPASASPPLSTMASLVAASVNDLCGDPAAGRCAAPPALVPTAPLPLGEAPALINALDLPPITGVTAPWAHTRPQETDVNLAASGCARADFAVPPMSRMISQTHLIPDAGLPDTFGLTETAAAVPVEQGKQFMIDYRDKLTACADEHLGTDVFPIATRTSETEDVATWRVTMEISDQAAVTYYIAVMRNDDAVAQTGFVPAPDADMPEGAFAALSERALARLADMPPPRRVRRGGNREG